MIEYLKKNKLYDLASRNFPELKGDFPKKSETKYAFLKGDEWLIGPMHQDGTDVLGDYYLEIHIHMHSHSN